jgi:carbonic anhydrase
VIELETSLHQFNPDDFGAVGDFLKTTDCNERDTLMIACADHGTAPDNVSFAGTDRFFILQHLAACIPSPEDGANDSAFAEVQFAFLNYDIKHIVLCGHLGCGVIPNWLKDTDAHDTGGLRARFRSTAVKAVEQAYPHLNGQELIERLICEHALFQLENLQSHPFIRNKLDSNELKLHLWIVNDETARVLAFDARKGDLVPIEETR